METAAELSVYFFGSWGVSLVILIGVILKDYVINRARDKANQKFMDKVADAIVEMNTIMKNGR